MTAIETRGDPHQIDAGWLTTALEAGGVARGATVIEVGRRTFIGSGQMGRSVRFPLKWDDPTGRPSSVVGKFPTDDPAARSNAFEGGAYLKELTFYATLRHTVHIRVPEAWCTLYDGDRQNFVLLMEDLSGSAQGDQFEGLSVDEVALGVGQAVALHAPRWGDDSLPSAFPDVARVGPEESADRLGGLYALFVEPALERLGPWADEEALTLARDLIPLVSKWVLGSDTPRTLAHMDFRAENLLFGTTASAPPLVVVDWQTFTYGHGANDLAYLIGGSFERDRRAEVERDLVEEYRRRLAATGIGYGAEVCWRDYRRASVWGVIMSVIATMLAEQTERGDKMLATMLRRHAHHARDVEAIDLLS